MAAACLLTGVMTYLCFIFFVDRISSASAVISSADIPKLELIIPSILLGVLFLLVFMIFWTFYTFNKILGPYTRVIRELDEVCAGKRTAGIRVRPGDEFFKEILMRVNVLIERANK